MRQTVPRAAGFTQASSVIARSQVEAGGIGDRRPRFDVPLKESALPKLSAALQVAPVIVPVLLLPELSVTVVPLPSLNP